MLEASAEGEADASRLAATVRADLGARSLPLDQAEARLRARGSRAPMPVPEPVAAELAAQDRALLQRVAYGDDVAADAEALLARAEPHAAALGRRTDLGEHLANVCLFALRAHLQQGRRQDAQRLGLRCLQLVPDAAPDPDVHPPRVRRALDRAGVARQRLGARLVVTTGPDDPGDCAVRVQGRRLGSTPRAEMLLAPGRVAVQVECDAEPGRVRFAEVAAGSVTELHILVSLDQALAAGGNDALALRYASRARREALRETHGAELARTLGVEAVVLAWQAPDAWHLAHVDAGGRVLTARFRVTDDEARREALEAFRAGRSIDRGPDEPQLMPRQRPPVAVGASTGGALSGRRTPTSLGFGYGFVLLGVGAAAGGFGTYVRWRETEDTLGAIDDVSFDRRLQQGDAALRGALEERRQQRIQALALGGGGAGFLSLAMPLLLPEREGVPWGAWVAGVLGAGALGAGLYLGRDHERPNGEGLRFQQEQPLAGLVALQSAPLLTIPLVYVLRWAVNRSRRGTRPASAWVQPAPGGARLTIRLTL